MKHFNPVRSFRARYMKKKTLADMLGIRRFRSIPNFRKTKYELEDPREALSKSLPATLPEAMEKETVKLTEKNVEKYQNKAPGLDEYDGEYSDDMDEDSYEDSEDSEGDYFESDDSDESDVPTSELNEDDRPQWEEFKKLRLLQQMKKENLNEAIDEDDLRYVDEDEDLDGWGEGDVDLDSSDDEFSGPSPSDHYHNQQDVCITGHCFKLEQEEFSNGNPNDSTYDSGLDESISEEQMEALMQARGDLLWRHIKAFNLGLVSRPETRNDGNCWYDAIADQIILHNLPDLPRDHLALRKAVIAAIPTLPQAEEWKKSVFGGEESMSAFLEVHSKDGEWTDSLGVMCQATALLVGREVRLVGTANIGQPGPGYTVLESGEGACDREPLTVGYYQDRHFQSLVKAEMMERSDSAVADLGLNMEEAKFMEGAKYREEAKNREETKYMEEAKYTEEALLGEASEQELAETTELAEMAEFEKKFQLPKNIRISRTGPRNVVNNLFG